MEIQTGIMLDIQAVHVTENLETDVQLVLGAHHQAMVSVEKMTKNYHNCDNHDRKLP
jgi:hypothetical protein